MMKAVIFAILEFVVIVTNGLYADDDNVVQLNIENFDNFIKTPGVSIIKFYASWCGHCEELAPKFKQAAVILKGYVQMGAVDNDNQTELGSRFNIKAYPTILIFSDHKKTPTRYEGSRDVQGIIQSSLNHIENVLKFRAEKEGVSSDFKFKSSETGSSCGGKSSGGSCRGSGGGNSCGAGRGSCGGGSYGNENFKNSEGTDSVFDLTDSNFDDLVLNSKDDWLVAFVAPWCPHCKSLKPQWKEAANQLRNKMKLGSVDSTQYQSLAQRYSIEGFPTIKYFPAGIKTGAPENFDGDRSASSIYSWAMRKLSLNKPPPEIKQLTSSLILQESCASKQLCIVAVLPKLYDCPSECRNNYIKIMKVSSEKFKQNDWAWLWLSARDYPELETIFEVGGFGYPTLVAVNSRKLKCAVMRGSFSTTGVGEFLRDLSMGRGSVPLVSIKSLPDIKTIDPWDGKDINEEDIIPVKLNSKSEL